MARAGELIEEPVTGQRIHFTATNADTGGEALHFELWLRPRGGRVGPRHVHARQEERVQVLSGAVEYRIGHRRGTARAGEELLVPAGVPHVLRNAGAVEVHAAVVASPAHRLEDFFERFCALGRAGALRRPGGALEMALLAREHELWLAGPPVRLQRGLARLLAPLGRRRRRRRDSLSAGAPPAA